MQDGIACEAPASTFIGLLPYLFVVCFFTYVLDFQHILGRGYLLCLSPRKVQDRFGKKKRTLI